MTITDYRIDWYIAHGTRMGLYKVRSPWCYRAEHFSLPNGNVFSCDIIDRVYFLPCCPQRIKFATRIGFLSLFLDVADAHLLTFFIRERHWRIIRGASFMRRWHRTRFITQLGIRDGTRSQTSMRESLAARAGNPPRDASTRVNYRVRATDSRTSVTRPRYDISPPSSLKTNSGVNSVGSHRSNRRSAPSALKNFQTKFFGLFPPFF